MIKMAIKSGVFFWQFITIYYDLLGANWNKSSTWNIFNNLQMSVASRCRNKKKTTYNVNSKYMTDKMLSWKWIKMAMDHFLAKDSMGKRDSVSKWIRCHSHEMWGFWTRRVIVDINIYLYLTCTWYLLWTWMCR